MLRKLLSFPFVLLIKLYQGLISPLYPMSCRFTPTCSQYGLEAFQRYPVWKAAWLTLRRISKCHPWGPHGHDPLP